MKQAKSTYAPRWVKTNAKRFPRANLRGARGVTSVADALSIFSPEAVKADEAAFRRLMQHIRDIDQAHSTILMVQVENEVGILGDSRDASPAAEKHFNDAVPAELLDMLSKEWQSLHPSLQKGLKIFKENQWKTRSSSWPETFGCSSRTDELFMAYHFALYVQRLARAGKGEYPIPLFTNVWQNYADEDADKSQPVVVGGGGEPGDYPSGGGVINVLDIWQAFAPALDFIAPDVYLNEYDAVCRKYRHRDQALFIPEQRRDEYGARRIWSAYGSHGALCTSPFGFDTMEFENNPWKRHYGLLAQVSEYVLAARDRQNAIVGFFFDEIDAKALSTPDTIEVQLGEWNLSIERSFVFGKPGPGFGMVIHLGAARFLLVGYGFQVRFRSAKEGTCFTGILAFREKVAVSGTSILKDGRILNGDETRSGEAAIMPNLHPDPGDFPICVTVPGVTGIAECEVYSID